MNPTERPWREREGRIRLLACRRPGRDALHFPPLPATSPLAAGAELVELSPTGTLYSFTVVHASPKANKAPVSLGLVDFADGVRVFARLDYPEGRRPAIGERLEAFVTVADAGEIYAFRPERA
jgi:uncharacterized OB-fold protein